MSEDKPYLGVNFDELEPFAFCGKSKWSINPEAHLKKVTDVIRESIKNYEETLSKVSKGEAYESERLEVYENSTKSILEVSLVNFDYEKEANNPDCGPALLGNLAIEIKDFLLVLGGKEGAKRSQMLLNLMKQKA